MIRPGDRVSMIAFDGRKHFGTVSWVGDTVAAVWWDSTDRGWRGPVSWLRRET